MTSITSDAKNRVGTRVQDRWTLNRLLGVGGTAAVYEATDAGGSVRALKIVHEDLLDDERVFKRLEREAEVVRKLAHPGIVPIHEVCKDSDGSLYLVMDLLDGFSMDHVRRNLGSLPERQLKWMAAELLHVVASAHSQGVLHRDLKPSNLYLTLEGALKVLDFGIARSRGASATGAHTSLHTMEGTVLGTPTFMSPEQARGRWSEVDERSDLWSVGATLFTLATGRPVHEARNPTEALGLAMTAQARPVAELVPTIDQSLAFCIDRALRFQASDRWPNAKTMYAALTSGPYVAHRTPKTCLDLVQRVASLGQDLVPESDPSLRTTIGHSRSGRQRVAANVLSRSYVEVQPANLAAANISAVQSANISDLQPSNVSAVQPAGSAAARANPDAGGRVALVQTTYWEVHELSGNQILTLTRTGAAVESTSRLRHENLKVIACFGEQYRGWGCVVDMRKAPARNDIDFEAAMQHLRQRLSTQFARVSVLVNSAAGLLQVTRIQRGDGTHTHITQNEREALRYAAGL
jgi:serine/threonine protein kinase